MIVLSEYSPLLAYSPSTRDLKIITEVARTTCEKVYFLPLDIERFGNMENALHHIPKFEQPQLAVWIGYIPSSERYEEVYNELSKKNLKLLNTPEEHQRAKLFHKTYPFIEDLTPKSCMIQHLTECEAVAKKLRFPLFVKGSVLSRKGNGLDACVAHDLEQLQRIVSEMLEHTWKTSGFIIIREYHELRHVRTAFDFSMGREYRVFLYKDAVLEYGYYWEGKDELSNLSKEEQNIVLKLAVETAKRLKTPYIAVDIGQKNDGEWIVIETGDSQFAGISQINPLKLWNKISQISC